MIDARLNLNHAYTLARFNQSHRRTRRTHANLHLGTDGHPFDESIEEFRYKAVAFVPPIETHFASK
jgi:hypothetical protein